MIDETSDTREVFLFACNRCGQALITAKVTTDADCLLCHVGYMQPVTLVAQHEGRVRVKLEIPK